MNKMRIGVLMGGLSAEREVSLNSGRTICDHLDSTQYKVVPLFQCDDGTLFLLPYKFLHRGKITDFIDRLKTEAQHIIWDNLKEYVDFLYIAMHGRFAEDGTLQGLLEVFDIPYLGSDVYTSAVCMDKVFQKKILQHHAINVPKGIVVTSKQIKNFKKEETLIHALLKKHNIQLPYIVKPHQEGSSLGVSIVHSHKELKKALEHACFLTKQHPQSVLVEEKINGMEFSCITLVNNKTNKPFALPPTEIIPEDNSHIF